MKLARRALVTAGFVGAAAFCFIRAACAVATDEGSDPYTLIAPLSGLDQKIKEAEWLDDELQRSMKRHEAKEAVVVDVMAGRLTLLEAAAQFRSLNAEWPLARHWLEQRFPELLYEEALCHDVIERVRSLCRLEAPEQAECMAACLMTELRRLLDSEDGLHLP
jgi:hypothetical protein